MDQVEAPAQRLGVAQVDRDQLTAPDLADDRQLGQEPDADPPLDHPLGRLDRLHLQHDVRHEPGPAKQAERERPVAGAAIEEDQRLARDLVQTRAPDAGHRAARRGHQHQRVFPQAHGLDLRMLERARQPELGVAGQHHVQHLLGVAGAHGDLGLGVGGLKTLEDVGQQVGADGQRSGDGQGAPARRAQIVHRLAGVRDHLQELLGVGAERSPGRRQRQPRLGALEQRDPQRDFQRLDARADGGWLTRRALAARRNPPKFRQPRSFELGIST
jgi:hypothetical protein